VWMCDFLSMQFLRMYKRPEVLTLHAKSSMRRQVDALLIFPLQKMKNLISAYARIVKCASLQPVSCAEDQVMSS